MRELSEFAEACYNNNTIGELIDALCEKKADVTDCKEWNLSPTLWREDIAEALRLKIQNFTSLDSYGHK